MKADGVKESQSPQNTDTEKQEQKFKRKKYLFFCIAFVIWQIIATLVFVAIFVRGRTPRFSVLSATFDGIYVSRQPDNASFNIYMNAQLGVKNPNFGTYRYKTSMILFFYRGIPVGEAVISKSSVGWKSTKEFNVVVPLTSAYVPPNSQLATDLSSGMLRLTSQAELRGKVALALIVNKRKRAQMNCTMDIVIATGELVNIYCL